MPSSTSTSSSRKRSRTPGERGRRTKKSKKATSKSKGTFSFGFNSAEESQHSSSESDSDSDSELGVQRADCKDAGRTIARCHDLFVNIQHVINIVLEAKQADVAADESEDEGTREHRRRILGKISSKKLARYKEIYALVLRLVPGFKGLLDDPSRSSSLKEAIQIINAAIGETRSTDTGKLRESIVSYATPPGAATLTPPIQARSPRSVMGLNHLGLAGYLCPATSAEEFRNDPEGTRKRLENGRIKMSSTAFPAFLWEDNGRNFRVGNMSNGFFRGFYIERVMRHIFTGPSTSMGGDARGSKPNNSELNHMDQVSGAQLAYAAVLARFGISSRTRWSEEDGIFNYRTFYYALMDLIDDSKDVMWRDALLKHYNILIFKDEKGRHDDFEDKGDDDDGDQGAGMFSMMQAQAAARASSDDRIDAEESDPRPVTSNPRSTNSPPASSNAVAHNPLSGDAPEPEVLMDKTNSASVSARPPSAPPAESNRSDPSMSSSVPAITPSPRTERRSPPRQQDPLSDLSDIERSEELAQKEKKKRAEVKAGKRKANAATLSDEERNGNSSRRPRNTRATKRGKGRK